MERQRLVREPRQQVGVEAGVGGEELLDERLIVERAPEEEQLEIGKRFRHVLRKRRIHTRRIGRAGVGL